eukprot:3455838-Amphidinium_carterae.1
MDGWLALKHATEALRADRGVVIAAVQENWNALQYASEALRADREVVRTALQQAADALRFAADELLEDASFATEAKRNFHLLKLAMLSGRSTFVVAGNDWNVQSVLRRCQWRLKLDSRIATMELWHGQDRVPDDGTRLRDWPGVQPTCEITEYQLLVRQ